MNQIAYEQRKEVYIEAIAKYGEKMQMVVAMEELLECGKEISKTIRGKGDIDHLAEEIADVTIMLEQLRLMHGINEKVCQHMDGKVARLAWNMAMDNISLEEGNE